MRKKNFISFILLFSLISTQLNVDNTNLFKNCKNCNLLISNISSARGYSKISRCSRSSKSISKLIRVLQIYHTVKKLKKSRKERNKGIIHKIIEHSKFPLGVVVGYYLHNTINNNEKENLVSTNINKGNQGNTYDYKDDNIRFLGVIISIVVVITFALIFLFYLL